MDVLPRNETHVSNSDLIMCIFMQAVPFCCHTQLTWRSTGHTRCPSRTTESFLASPCSQTTPLFQSSGWTTPDLLILALYITKGVLCNYAQGGMQILGVSRINHRKIACGSNKQPTWKKNTLFGSRTSPECVVWNKNEFLPGFTYKYKREVIIREGLLIFL